MRTYGSLELTVGSPAQSIVEPFTVPQVMAWLNETVLSPNAIVNIEALIRSARAYAESKRREDLVRKQWDLWLDGFHYDCESPYGIRLRRPLHSVDLVQYRDSEGTDTALVDTTDYRVDSSAGILFPPYGRSWPSFTPYPSSAVLVRFTSGYSKTHPFWSHHGSNVLHGMRMLITEWYQNRLTDVDPDTMRTIDANIAGDIPPGIR